LRKRTKLGLCIALGGMLVVLTAYENLPLAALVGMAIGAVLFVFLHAYPNDIAPPADRRHENTLRRRTSQRETLR
jgi:hypothetical protein